jgi:hypothetical protein
VGGCQYEIGGNLAAVLIAAVAALATVAVVVIVWLVGRRGDGPDDEEW